MKRTSLLYLSCLLLLGTLLSGCEEPKRIPDTLPDVYGYITDIKRTATNGKVAKAVVAVKSMEGVEANYPDASISIDENTLIEDEDGKELTLSQLREGHEVQAWFAGDILDSKPIQGYAKAVRIKY